MKKERIWIGPNYDFKNKVFELREQLHSNRLGFHYYYFKGEHQNPLPAIRLANKENQKSKKYPHDWTVIRICQGKYTLTDWRSSFSNDLHIRPEEF